jgi:hypothetical protein
MALEKQPDRYEILLQASENLVRTVSDMKEDLSGVKKDIGEMKKVVNRLPGDSRMQLAIKTRATKKVAQIVGSPSNPLFRKTISALWHDFWQAFAVTTYKDTPAALFDEAISYIDRWSPMQLVGLEEPQR